MVAKIEGKSITLRCCLCKICGDQEYRIDDETHDFCNKNGCKILSAVFGMINMLMGLF